MRKADREKVKDIPVSALPFGGHSKLPLSPRTPASFLGFPGAVTQGWKLFFRS